MENLLFIILFLMQKLIKIIRFKYFRNFTSIGKSFEIHFYKNKKQFWLKKVLLGKYKSIFLQWNQT